MQPRIGRPTRGFIHNTLLLLILCTPVTTQAAPSLSTAFLSAGLSEALSKLGSAADPGPPISAGSTFIFPQNLAPLLWSVELFGAGGDSGQPAMLLSSDERPFPQVALSSSVSNGEPSRISLTFTRHGTVGEKALFRLELGSGSDDVALAPGAYTAATAAVTPGSPLLDILYNVDHCHANERGFVIDQITTQAGQLVKLIARFHCGANFSGVLRYEYAATANSDVVVLTGTVWEDQDANGVRSTDDPDAEAGLAAVRLDLLKDGRRIATTLSDEQGAFNFEAPYGSYQIEVRPPSGLALAPHDAGADDAHDSDLDPASGRSELLVPGPADIAYDNGGHRAELPALTVGLGFPGGRPLLPIASTRLMPLKQGDHMSYWRYAGQTHYLTDTVLPGGARLAGSAGLQLRDSDGNQLWLSNDGLGLRLHRAVVTPGAGKPVEISFAPAMVLLPGQVGLGRHNSSGQVTVRQTNGKTTTLRYVLSADVFAGQGGVSERLADLPGPRAREVGVRVSTSLRFTGRLRDSPFNATTRSTDLIALDQGIVHSQLDGFLQEHRLLSQRRGFGDSIDRNRTSDVLAWNAAESRFGMWRMRAAATPLWAELGTASSGATELVKGDFDGDGLLDVVSHESDSGLISLSRGTGLALPLAFAPSGSELQSAGDFDRDGRSDLVWRMAGQSRVTLWFFNSLSAIGSADVRLPISGDPAAAPTTWSLLGTGDFDADGTDDLLWFDPATNRYVQWFMTNFAQRARTSSRIMAAPHRLAAIDDFDGDGHSDLLWFNPRTRELRAWLMDGSKVRSDSVIAQSSAGAKLVDSGDFNGDGAADLLMQTGSAPALHLLRLREGKVLSRHNLGGLPPGYVPLP